MDFSPSSHSNFPMVFLFDYSMHFLTTFLVDFSVFFVLFYIHSHYSPSLQPLTWDSLMQTQAHFFSEILSIAFLSGSRILGTCGMSPCQKQDYENHSYQQSSKVGYNPRTGFIKKVYGILSVQLLITAAFVYLSLTYLQSFFSDNKNQLLNMGTIVCGATTLIVSFVICCYTSIARTVPTNYILLFLFTFCESFLVARLTSLVPAEIVLLAGGLTLTLTLTLTLYACTTKTDFTSCGAVLFVLAWTLFAAGAIFFWGAYSGNREVYRYYCVLCVAVYGFYLVYDTQIVAGNGRYQLSMDDYVVGALIIYIDIIVIFIKILQALRR